MIFGNLVLRPVQAFDVESPLHIAAMLGHVEFAKEILRRKPELAGELDSQRSSPLHLATAKGYLEIVKLLLLVNPEMCLARDRDGRNPLHLAAMKGQVNVLKELVRTRHHAARVTVDRGKTILHLCAKHNQLEALKLLVETMGDVELVNAKDDDGFTILHLAVGDKQTEIINFLLTSARVDVNAINANGLTAFDILAQSLRDVKDMDIVDSLRGAGALSARDVPLSRLENRTIRAGGMPLVVSHQIMPLRSQGEKMMKNVKQDDWLSRKRDSLMVVAVLIATMAFQVGVNPPGGVWQDTLTVDPEGSPVAHPHTAGASIMADNYPQRYQYFLRSNTLGFIASLSIILLLISGLPFKRRLFMWILMEIMLVTITSVALTYAISIAVITPKHEEEALTRVIQVAVVLWCGLMGLLFLWQTIRLITRSLTKLKRFIRKERSSSLVHGDYANV